MNRSRGTALPETAALLATALTLLYGTMELGMFGLAQLSADGAAYSVAHATVLGQNVSVAASPFPQIPAGGLSTSQNNPLNTDVPVDYQVANQNNRHGGVQVVVPAQLQATAQTPQQSVTAYGFPGLSVTLNSGFIEGSMQVNGHGYDIYGDNLNSQASYNLQQSYFSEDGNAPPYFIGFHLMYACGSVRNGSTCSSSATLNSMALAEFLDADNWANNVKGTNTNGVYQAMSFHYEVYEKIAKSLLQSGYAPIDPQSNPCIETVHGWDYTALAHSTDPRADPEHPMSNVGGC